MRLPWKRRPDEGYILVMVSILMVVMLVFAALVIDVSMLYSRGNKLQAAADAAALAGVQYMPGNLTRARTAALDAAKANGFDGTDPNVTITVTAVAGSPRRLNVEIRDAAVKTVFGGAVRPSFAVRRDATSEYVPSIPVGSPVNELGYGPDQNFWLAVNGYCTAKEDGDQYLAGFDGTRDNTGSYGCNSGPQPLANTDYNNKRSGASSVPSTKGGYSYLVHVPCTSGGTSDPTIPCDSTDRTTAPVTIQMFDPWFNPGLPDSPDVIPNPGCSDPSSAWFETCGVTTIVQVYPPDTTPSDYSDDVAVFSPARRYSPDGCACSTAAWTDLYTIPVGSQTGSWRVQVYTLDRERRSASGSGYNSFGVNAFSLRAFRGGTYSTCNASIDATCVGVSGDAAMSLFAQAPTASAEFYLARLSPASEFRGKQVRVSLWDPGEGGQSIQIVEPGVPLNQASVTGYPFVARLGSPGLNGYSADSSAYSYTGRVLDVTGAPEPSSGFNVSGTARANPTKFNGRLVELTLTIPANYGLDGSGNEAALPDDGWWRIRYNFGAGTVRDRTTWSVKLVGDPVHLVPGG
ncbi:MAG: pilus assembly protein TadG-related protein [Acidimicrobiia bacterium]